MTLTTLSRLILLSAAAALMPVSAPADATDTQLLLAHESPKLERCETRLARTGRALTKARRDADGYKARLERAAHELRQQKAAASAGGNCGASGNLKSAAKATAGQNGCGGNTSCVQTIPFNVPNPTGNLELAWVNGMLQIQGNMIFKLAPDQPMSVLEAEEAKVCKSSWLYCKAAFRQLVISELVR